MTSLGEGKTAVIVDASLHTVSVKRVLFIKSTKIHHSITVWFLPI
jgi:hypothetical protein